MWCFSFGDMITMISQEDDRITPPPGTAAKAAPLPEVEVEVWPLTLFVTMVPPLPPEEDALPLNDEALQSKTPAIRFQNGEIQHNQQQEHICVKQTRRMRCNQAFSRQKVVVWYRKHSTPSVTVHCPWRRLRRLNVPSAQRQTFIQTFRRTQPAGSHGTWQPQISLCDAAPTLHLQAAGPHGGERRDARRRHLLAGAAQRAEGVGAQQLADRRRRRVVRDA